MRIACLYDIHGNLPALDAVLEDVRKANVDRLVIGGDVVPGPMPRECFERLRSLIVPVACIAGNGDRATRQARQGAMDPKVPAFFHAALRWNAAQLSDGDASMMAAWPLTLTLQMPDIGTVVFCHATPRDDNEIFVNSTAEAVLKPLFDPLRADLVICGHTNMQFDRMVGTTRVINAGSVGMPFQAPGAYWVLLGSAVELRRTAYDTAAAADASRRTAYPLAEQTAAGVVTPPAEAVMLEQFQQAEIRS
ncbi:MAG: metallophosphoesterase family protein [Acidimicrobiia bacterium]